MNWKSALLTVSICLAGVLLSAQDIRLPAPRKTGGKTLMQCLAERKTARDFQPDAKLSLQQISELAYSVCGFNRPDRLTIPTARNVQDLMLYIALDSGVYSYDARENTLKMILKGDHRGAMGLQTKMFQRSSAVLLYVSDFSKLKCKESDRVFYAASHAGSAYQDVYLYCASENLATVVCGLLNREKIAGLLKFPKNYRIQYSQPVGVPAK